jgi:hypothetical protein
MSRPSRHRIRLRHASSLALRATLRDGLRMTKPDPVLNTNSQTFLDHSSGMILKGVKRKSGRDKRLILKGKKNFSAKCNEVIDIESILLNRQRRFCGSGHLAFRSLIRTTSLFAEPRATASFLPSRDIATLPNCGN